MHYPIDIYDQPPDKKAAAIWVPNDDFSKFWMSRRLASCSFTDRIQMPGGSVKPGETVVAGALRELQEETGIVSLPRELKPIGLITMGFVNYVPYYMHWFCLVPEETVTPKNMEPDKHTDWTLMSLEEMLRDKLIPGNYTAIRHLDWWLQHRATFPSAGSESRQTSP